MLPEREILALHRAITAIRSVSGEEAAVADALSDLLRRNGVAVTRLGPLGASLLATVGEGPLLLFDTHLDTVPPSAGWTRDPWDIQSVAGKVYGLGSNDAKAAVAAMTAAFLAFREADLPFTLALALVEGEETRGTGTEAVLAELSRRGTPPMAAVVGEPTGLDLAVSQKGLMVLELVARGDACHAANAAALGAANAARRLARDLVALEGVDFGPPHPRLGPITLEPTQLRAGTARNVVPDEAMAVLDVRTTPALEPGEVLERIRGVVTGEVRVLSDRLRPRETPETAPLVAAAREARPEARLFGSAALSDMVFLQGIPAIKCGPGRSERSHTPDEFVLESEILAGARFYARLVRAYAEGLVEAVA
ncbi:MAG TPA: M20/M25/M40 family metallo-hydrolase [Thermoanaerobaculia bacterium]|jgi:acetylornithine deacetylase